MSEWVFPRDVMLLIFQYGALACTPKIARLCKALRDYTRTPAYWERAVRGKIAQRLAGLIDDKRLALIDVWHGMTARQRTLPMSDDDLFKRVSWMFARIGSVMQTAIGHSCLRGRHGGYSQLGIVNAGSGAVFLRWTWHNVDHNDFTVTYVDDDTRNVIDEFILHPTVRQIVTPQGYSGYYVIEDPVRKRLWKGPASYHWDEKTKTGRMIPDETQRELLVTYPFVIGSWFDIK